MGVFNLSPNKEKGETKAEDIIQIFFKRLSNFKKICAKYIECIET